MQIIYRKKVISSGGQAELIEHRLELPLLVGRGGSSDLILSYPGLAPEHARFVIDNERLIVETRASGDLVLKNGSTVHERTDLIAGDRVKLGALELTIFKEDTWGLLEHEIADQRLSEDEILLTSKLLHIENRLPSVWRIGLSIGVVTLLTFFLGPVLSQRFISWTSGPISVHHQIIAANCTTCHEKKFTRVQDSACLSCHKLTAHAESLADLELKKTELKHSCADCHFEHRGDHGLITPDSRQCSDCHANIQSLIPGSKHPNIETFDKHPEFLVTLELRDSNKEKPRYKKVSLDNSLELVDFTHIKLNHQIHLKPELRGPNGATQLYCKDCHALAADNRTIQPITFDKNCRSCHNLEFDERLPGNQVPHNKPNTVFNYMFAEYAKLLLNTQEKEAQDRGFTRFRPGEDAPVEKKTEYVKKYVEDQARLAEKLLFTRTACYLCHDVSEKSDFSDEISTGTLSKYEVLEPHIPDRWMAASTFSHGSHEALKCESCHSGARQSTKTSDVLMPRIETCRDCHSSSSNMGKVSSKCIMCHSYHDQLQLDPEQKREIPEVLKKAGLF